MPHGKRKRSLQLQPHQLEQLRQIIEEQINLEIALKKQLLNAARARLEWALVLKNSIKNSDSNTITSEHPSTAFEEAALTTYEAIEKPCRFIAFVPEVHSHAWNVLRETRVSETSRSRKRITQGSIGPILFEDLSTSTPVTLKIACPDCARTNFSTMQGFINHCRLGHSRSYVTHDDCIQACGVVVNDSERKNLLAAGAEISTIHLPSVKGLFERAVGLAPNVPFTSDATELSRSVGGSPEATTHLSQTLGLHKDTPTLAPFLGKEMKKKCINIYDDSESLDIISPYDHTISKYRSWIVKRRPRRHTGGEWFVNMLAVEAKTSDVDGPPVLTGLVGSQSSRFHVTRRILVSDRSLRLAENKRPSSAETMSHTHCWQISVSSPSYGQPIATFLSRLIVTCVTQPPVFTTPITISEPPFVACSTTDRSFLARVTLEWVGQLNHAFELEHWVELDQLKAVRPVSGKEQILDIELDRNTTFLPERDHVDTIPWNGDRDYGQSDTSRRPIIDSQVAEIVEVPRESEPEYIKLLKRIVPQFPVTFQDLGHRPLPRAFYTIHRSPATFLSLVPGRRKAIEWSVAQAIRSEYDNLNATSSGSETNIRLTTADVYRWLASEGLFPRHRPKVRKPTPPSEFAQVSVTPGKNLMQTLQSFCSVCGVDVRFHPLTILPLKSPDQTNGEIVGFHCPPELERRRAPLVHAYALVAPLRIPYWAPPYEVICDNVISSTPEDLVTLAHPYFTRFVRQEVGFLNLSCFGTRHKVERRPGYLSQHELTYGSNRQEVDAVLGPYAFLAIILEHVVKDIVGSALEVARSSQSRTPAISSRMEGSTQMSLLTPTHVLQGLIKGAEMGGRKEALFKSLSRVGTALQSSGVATSGGGRGEGSPSSVKEPA